MEKEPLEKVKLDTIRIELPKNYQQVCCPSCDSEILAADMNIHDKVAKCMECNVLFPLQETIQSLTKSTASNKQEVMRPEGIDIFRFKGDLEFSFNQSVTGERVIFWFTLPFFALLATLVYYKKDISIWVPIAIWIPTIAGIIYSSFQSKIRLNIGKEFLTIKRRPKKGYPDQSYAIQEIDQLYINPSPAEGGFALYMVVNSIAGQKNVLLVDGLTSRAKALYLEQEIERHIGIVDREVVV